MAYTIGGIRPTIRNSCDFVQSISYEDLMTHQTSGWTTKYTGLRTRIGNYEEVVWLRAKKFSPLGTAKLKEARAFYQQIFSGKSFEIKYGNVVIANKDGTLTIDEYDMFSNSYNPKEKTQIEVNGYSFKPKYKGPFEIIVGEDGYYVGFYYFSYALPNNSSKHYPVMFEEDIEVADYLNFDSKDKLSAKVGQRILSSTEIKQTLISHKINHLKFNTYEVLISSSETKESSFETLNYMFQFATSDTYFMPKNGLNFTETLNNYIVVKNNETCLTKGAIEIKIIDDTTRIWKVEETSTARYNIYVGQDLGQDFYSSFKVTKTNVNEFIPSATIEAQVGLNAGSFTTYQILKQGDEVLNLEYNFDGQPIKFTVNKNLHRISINNFDAVNNIKDTYQIGDKFEYNLYSINEIGSFYYTDNTTISASKMNELDPNLVYIFGASVKDGEIINENTQNPFQAQYELTSNIFGTINYQFDVDISDSTTEKHVDNVKLIDSIDTYKYGEIVQFGINSSLQLRKGSLVIKTLSFNEFKNLVNKDHRYGKAIDENSGLLIDTPIELLSLYNGHQFSQTIRVSYASDLVLNTDNVTKTIYFDDSFLDFDYSGLTAKVVYHALGIVENRPIDYSALQISHDTFDKSQTRTYAINVATTYEGRILKKTFEIKAIKKAPIEVRASGVDTTIYYDNDQSQFAKPTGINFSLQWNDGSTTSVNLDTDLSFYRDKELSRALKVGDVIKKKDGNIIYVKHNETGLVGQYFIEFKVDKIVAVEMVNQVEIPLGNYLSNYKNKCQIKVTFISDVIIENFVDWKFVEINRVDKPIDTIYISINEEHYKITGISFVAPKILSITSDLNKFHTSFNNTNDSIDCRPLSFVVRYENSEYTQIVNTYVKETLNQINEFSVTCSELPNFTFDGSQKISYSMPSQEVIHNTKLVVKVKSAFNTTEFGTYEIPIQIVEITDITGLKLLNATTEYKVGEAFLNEKDETRILIFYKTPNGESNKIDVALNSGFSALNIYPLKGTIFYNQDKDKVIRISCATNSNIYVEYSIEVINEYEYHDTTSHKLRAVRFNNYTLPNGVERQNIYLIVNDSDTEVINGIRQIKQDISLEKVKIYGFLDDIGDTSKNARLVLFEDYVPVIDGESNISITYPCYVKGNADLINNCKFGQLFGNNNAKNRLFLSGNKEHPNADWHSGAVNESKQDGESIEVNGDFTYFEDTSIMNYGQSDNKIIGYDIVSDGKMIVFKDKSDKEPTIYYRTNGLISAIDGSGNAQTGFDNKPLYQEYYPLVIGNSKGIGAINNKSIVNFNGNTLFLSSENELDMLIANGLIGDSQRYASSVSRLIDPALKKTKLNKSFLWTNNKYLYIVNEDNIFATYFDQIIENNFEWWKLDIKGISTLLEFDNKTYYGTINGEIGLLENNIFQDVTKIFLPKGDIKLKANEIDGDKLTINKVSLQKVNQQATNYFRIDASNSDPSSYIYAFVARLSNTKTGNVDIYINGNANKLEIVGTINGVSDKDKIKKIRDLIHEDAIYYLDKYEGDSHIVTGSIGSPLREYYKQYKLKQVPSEFGENACFGLFDILGNRVDISQLYRASLCSRVDDLLQMVDINLEESSFKLLYKNEKLDLVKYGDQDVNDTFDGEIWSFFNIPASYITAPLTMGDFMYDKTIWGYTLTNDTNIPSQVELCQVSNEDDLIVLTTLSTVKKNDYGMSLRDFNLNDLSFDKVVIPHKYTYYKPILVPFISFCFMNNDSSNCVLSALSISYSIAKNSYGSY